jgi:hypothetical protein
MTGIAEVAQVQSPKLDRKNGTRARTASSLPRVLPKATTEEALVKLTQLGQQGRYKRSILEDAKRRLEAGDD